MKKLLTVLAVAVTAVVGVCPSGFATDYTVGSGETMELKGTTAADARNASANTILLQSGSTLKLVAENGTVANGQGGTDVVLTVRTPGLVVVVE